MLSDLIKRQASSKPASEIDEMILDDWRGTELTAADKALLEGFPQLQFLSFNGCGLKTLHNFPNLPELLKLDLNDNKIASGLNAFSGLKNMMQLGLAGNLIKRLEDLRPLSGLDHLVALDLFSCPVSNAEGFREAVFKLIPKLEILNRANQEGEEVSMSEDDEEEDSDCSQDEDEGDQDELAHILNGDSSEEDEFLEDLEKVRGGNCTLIDASDDSEEDEEEPEPVKKRKI